MKIGLVGGSYQQSSLPFDASRTINMYPVISESQSSAEISALYGVHGKTLFTTAGDGLIRGGFTSENGRCFVVSNNALYEIDENGTATSRGTLDTTATNCTMDENGLQLAICDGTDLYIFTYSSNAFAKVSDLDFPGAATVTFVDGYFAYNDPDTGRFYISAAYDGLNVDALDFATAEAAPDDLIRVIQVGGQLFLMGRRTTEVWYNSGDATFPFAKVSGGKIETGIAAAHTACQLDNSLFWVGRDKDGYGIVYKMEGYSPKRISTTAIEKRLQALTENQIANLRAWTYQKEGHAFYVITGSGLDTSLCYDAMTGQWHERAYLNALGNYETDRASCCFFAFGKHLVGDRQNGKIYELTDTVYDDNGDEMAKERIFTHLINEATRMTFNELEVYFESGVGLTSGQGSDPVAILQISKDGGRTWGNELTASIGALGEYQARAVWRRLGVGRTTTFKIKVTDPVKVRIIGAYLK